MGGHRVRLAAAILALLLAAGCATVPEPAAWQAICRADGGQVRPMTSLAKAAAYCGVLRSRGWRADVVPVSVPHHVVRVIDGSRVRYLDPTLGREYPDLELFRQE